MKHWFLQTWLAIDQLINAMFLRGWADETMSSRLWRLEQRGKPMGVLRRVVDFLASPFEEDHCQKSFESERAGNQLPPELRGL